MNVSHHYPQGSQFQKALLAVLGQNRSELNKAWSVTSPTTSRPSSPNVGFQVKHRHRKNRKTRKNRKSRRSNRKTRNNRR